MKKLKCESCGGTINVDDESSEFATCPFCQAKYQLNERKNIYFKMDDNTKELLETGMKHFNQTSKLAFIPFVIIFIIIIIIFVGVFTSMKKHSNYNKPSSDDQDEVIESIKDRVSKTSFNSTYEFYSGTEYKTTVEILVDKVVTNNKTNKDMLISVIYGDNDTTDPDTIINIKHSLNDRKKYEVKLDYDEDGYVNKITIEDI